jgi:predicted nuclease of predicted toxin-antitoxin system
VEDIIDLGYDVVHVRLANPGMSDDEIIHQSEKEKRIIITLDKDFGYLV